MGGMNRLSANAWRPLNPACGSLKAQSGVYRCSTSEQRTSGCPRKRAWTCCPGTKPNSKPEFFIEGKKNMSTIGRRIGLIVDRTCNLGALILLAVACTRTTAQLSSDLPTQPQITVSATKDGLTAKIGSETLHVTVCGDAVIHVVASPINAASAVPEQPWMLPP